MDVVCLVRLKIKTMDNKMNTVECSSTATVLELKQIVEQAMGVPAIRQRLIFQGKMMEDQDCLIKYNVQDDFVVHLIANLPEQVVVAQNTVSSIEELVASTQSITQDLEILSEILRTLRQTTFNRQNLRRVIMQQRGNGFNLDREGSLESIKQNYDNIQQMMECQVTVGELKQEELTSKDAFINPFKFQNRRLKVGQWIDLKDTIDQWLEAQVVEVRDQKVYVHYNGWAKRWDEWINMDSSRIALFRTYTVGSITQDLMSPMPVTEPDAENLERQDFDMNEFIFDVGFLMNKVTAMLIEFGKYQNFKKLKEKQLQLRRQQYIIQQLKEENKDEYYGEEEYQEEIMQLTSKSSLMSSQLGPIFDRMGRMMIDLAPHFAMLGAQTQTIEDTNTRTHVFQVPVMLTPSELNQTQIQSQTSSGANPFDAINARLGNLRQYIDRQQHQLTPIVPIIQETDSQEGELSLTNAQIDPTGELQSQDSSKSQDQIQDQLD